MSIFSSPLFKIPALRRVLLPLDWQSAAQHLNAQRDVSPDLDAIYSEEPPPPCQAFIICGVMTACSVIKSVLKDSKLLTRGIWQATISRTWIWAYSQNMVMFKPVALSPVLHLVFYGWFLTISLIKISKISLVPCRVVPSEMQYYDFP